METLTMNVSSEYKAKTQQEAEAIVIVLLKMNPDRTISFERQSDDTYKIFIWSE